VQTPSAAAPRHTVPGALPDVPPPRLGSAHHDRPPLESVQAQQVLAAIRSIEGVLGCAVVDAATGRILAHASNDRADLLPWQVEPAAMASTQIFRAHRLAAREMGLDAPVDEILATVGGRHLVLRGVSRHRGLFVFAVIDRQRCNLSLARYRVMEAEQRLT
jgi:predicted regulator of Ras-like GTPase activity (Roadblock/LC7/MglB family)